MKKLQNSTPKELLGLLKNQNYDLLEKILVDKFLTENFKDVLKSYQFNDIYFSIAHKHYICDGCSYFRIDNRKQQNYLTKYKTLFVKMKETNNPRYENQEQIYNFIDNDFEKHCIYDYEEPEYCNYTDIMFNQVDNIILIDNNKYNIKYLDMVCQINDIKGFQYVIDKKKSNALKVLDHNNQILAFIFPLK